MMDSDNPKPSHNPQRPRRQSKGMYILPSLFTTGNMAAGYYAILQIMHATANEFWHLDNAAIAIGFAVLFDGLDGRIARMTGTSSDFGRELDSLADVITFGVAPAMLAWTWGFHLMTPVTLTQLHLNLGKLGAAPRSRLFFFLAALFASIYYFSLPVFFGVALLYMLSGVFWRLQWFSRRRSGPPPPPYKEASPPS